MVHLQYILSTRVEMNHSEFSQECVREGLTVYYSRRLSPHSVSDLLEPWLMSSFSSEHWINVGILAELGSSSNFPVMYKLTRNDLSEESNQICIQDTIRSWCCFMSWGTCDSAGHNSINLMTGWVSVVPSVNDLEFFLLTFYHNLSSDSDGVLNLCKVGSLLIMLHEMWLQRFFLWLAG